MNIVYPDRSTKFQEAKRRTRASYALLTFTYPGFEGVAHVMLKAPTKPQKGFTTMGFSH